MPNNEDIEQLLILSVFVLAAFWFPYVLIRHYDEERVPARWDGGGGGPGRSSVSGHYTALPAILYSVLYMERDRVTVQQAASRLGISEGAVRKRVARGTLEHDKADDGRVYVYLDAGVDAGQDAGVDPHSNALISQLRDEIAYLREENRRKDQIIMQQAISMRQLTGGSELPDEPVQGEEPSSGGEGSEEETSRPWWRRFFGF